VREPVAGANSTQVRREHFGAMPSGEAVWRYVLRSPALEVHVMTLGAGLVAIHAPDRAGRWRNVVLGHATLEEYLRPGKAYFGVICGRYANRLGGAAVDIDGVCYPLSANEGGETTLHGGAHGFDAYLWQAAETPDGVELSLRSPHGDQGFPGNLDVSVAYTLRNATLTLRFRCTTDRPTVLNLTNHAYFNLAGESSGSVLDHLLQVYADLYVPVDERLLPTGELRNVTGTPFDFRKPRRVGKHLPGNSPELRANRGYNHTFVLPRKEPNQSGPATLLTDNTSGRVLRVHTTEPGVHLYTGGFLDGAHTGAGGLPYGPSAGACLETQHFPDGPHHAAFPSTLLRPGTVWTSETSFEFGSG